MAKAARNTLLPASKEWEDDMPESVYDVILLIGSSKESWEKAAANAVEQASKSLGNLRVAEIVEFDMQLGREGKGGSLSREGQAIVQSRALKTKSSTPTLDLIAKQRHR